MKMRKTFELEDLDCANCAAKMTEGIRKIEGVSYADVNFLSQKLTIEAEDSEFDAIMKRRRRSAKKLSPTAALNFKRCFL